MTKVEEEVAFLQRADEEQARLVVDLEKRVRELSARIERLEGLLRSLREAEDRVD